MHNSEEEQIPGPQQLTSSPSWQHVTPPKARAKSPTVSQMSVASVPVVTPQDLLSQLSAEERIALEQRAAEAMQSQSEVQP